MIPNVPNIQSPERYTKFELSREKLEYALAETLKKVDYMMEYFNVDQFPAENSTGQVYGRVGNVGGWGTGFYSGILWHAYQLTGDEKYKERALAQIPGYYKRIDEKIGVNHHDMGFFFIPSCVAAYKLEGRGSLLYPARYRIYAQPPQGRDARCKYNLRYQHWAFAEYR